MDKLSNAFEVRSSLGLDFIPTSYFCDVLEATFYALKNYGISWKLNNIKLNYLYHAFL